MKELLVISMKRVLKNLKLNPLHFILGIMITAMGAVLMFNDTFFYWPPEWQWFFNNDLVDIVVILIGIGLIAFVLMGGKNQIINAVLLSASAVFLTVLTVLQIGHVMVIHDFNRWLLIILLAGWIFVIQYLATHSKTVKRRK